MLLFADAEMAQEESESLAKLLAEAHQRSYFGYLRREAVVRRVIGVLQDWFEACEQGRANERYPSPRSMVAEEEANRLIEVIDRFFEEELSSRPEYWREQKGVDAPPQFSRLESHARRALAEDLHRALK